jgi:phenylpyruvate tautomerase PptA (4-oxalocrotonate tautomerase family)
MPMIDIKIPAGHLDQQSRQDLADRLTAALLRWEKAPDNDITRGITWAYFDDREVYVGGAAADQPRYVVLVTVPEGALSDRRKAGLVEEATQIVLEADGADPSAWEDKFRVWVHIHEVPEGHWGAAGQIFRYKDIVATVNGGVHAAEKVAAS